MKPKKISLSVVNHKGRLLVVSDSGWARSDFWLFEPIATTAVGNCKVSSGKGIKVAVAEIDSVDVMGDVLRGLGAV
jgi:hypothetical protein